MSSVDTRPQVVDIDHYAGDTLTLHVKVSAAVVAGRTWTAQVRSNRTSYKIDATFEVFPTSFGADVMLHTEDSRRLTARGAYIGYWDVQLSEPDGSDPVTTLAHGELRLQPDVTRMQT
jgi:hypothetical protein